MKRRSNHSNRASVPEAPLEEAYTKSLFRKLESLETEMDTSLHTGQSRWMIPYADLLTLLLGLFLVLFSQSHPGKLLDRPDHPAKTAPVSTVKAGVKTASATLVPPESAAMSKLEAQLQNTLKLKGLEIRHQERGVVISLKDSILFAAGSADLSPSAKKTLDHLTQQLNAALAGASRPIRVEGHTDNTPITTMQYPSNWELSTARATNIVRYLIAGHHFRPDQLSAAGYGEFRPMQNNSSIEGKQKNRRVDIVVLNENMAQQEPPALVSSVNKKTLYENINPQ
jgi:chemotaxis protein MotB